MIDRSILESSPVEVIFGDGAAAQVGKLARRFGARRRVLVVTDPAIVAAGWAGEAVRRLEAETLRVTLFEGAEPNPTTETIERGITAAARGASQEDAIDLIVGLGGGSAMDCAKGINLLLRCGGRIADYRGDADATTLAARPALLPMILMPTTAGTGSEAQSFALISDAKTHMKMACGDRRRPGSGGLRPIAAILDPQLTATAPPSVAIATSIDAISHAIETAGCRVRNEVSRRFSIEAWRLLATNFATSITDRADDTAREAMLLGAHLAGCAIEQSMLGAAHACANPLTAHFGITHGIAVGVMLPHVIRFNARDGDENPYAALDRSPSRLAATVESMLDAGGIARRLSGHGVTREALAMLAEDAAKQWTAGFNPVPVGAAELLAIYQSAWG